MPHQTNTMASFLIFNFIVFATIPKETTAAIAVNPVQLAVEVGQEAVFLCTHDDGKDATTIVWTYGTDLSSTIPAPASSASSGPATVVYQYQRVTSHQGTLTVRNATHTDRGRYYCWPDTSSPDGKLEANLVVYVMPDYMTDIFAVAILCGVLVLLLGILVTRQWVQQQARLRREEQARSGRKAKVNGAWNGGRSFSEGNSKTPPAPQEVSSGTYKMNILGNEPDQSSKDGKILSVSF